MKHFQTPILGQHFAQRRGSDVLVPQCQYDSLLRCMPVPGHRGRLACPYEPVLSLKHRSAGADAMSVLT